MKPARRNHQHDKHPLYLRRQQWNGGALLGSTANVLGFSAGEALRLTQLSQELSASKSTILASLVTHPRVKELLQELVEQA